MVLYPRTQHEGFLKLMQLICVRDLGQALCSRVRIQLSMRPAIPAFAGRVPWAKNLSREGGIQGLRGGSWEFGFGHVELDSAGRHLGTQNESIESQDRSGLEVEIQSHQRIDDENHELG